MKIESIQSFIIAEYLFPSAAFDQKTSESIHRSCPPPYILAGDFDAEHLFLRRHTMNSRGNHSAKIQTLHDLCLLNRFIATFLQGVRYSSCLSLTFASASVSPLSSWFADVETWASNDIPMYTTTSTFINLLVQQKAKHYVELSG